MKAGRAVLDTPWYISLGGMEFLHLRLKKALLYFGCHFDNDDEALGSFRVRGEAC